MKKFILLLLCVPLLFSCQDAGKELLQETTPLSIAADLKTSIEPIFSVKDGYLHLQSIDDVTRMMSFINKMSVEKRNAWEKEVGFNSATTYYAQYFDDFEALTTKEELIRFCEEYKDILSIENNEGNGIGIDYPFKSIVYLPLLSKDGCFAVGNSVYIIKKDRSIEIHSATDEKIAKYRDALESIPDEKVFVEYANVSKTRATQIDKARVWTMPTDSSIEWLYNKGTAAPSNRRLKLYIETSRLREEVNNSSGRYRYEHIVIFYMRAEKHKTIGSWSHYETSYYLQDINYRCNSGFQIAPDMHKKFKGGGHVLLFKGGMHGDYNPIVDTFWQIDMSFHCDAFPTPQPVSHINYGTYGVMYPMFQWNGF